MTPEHLNRTIVDRCCDALKILMRTSCAEIIKEAITQAKKEAYEEIYLLAKAELENGYECEFIDKIRKLAQRKD